jgi:hypothetical protein
VVARGSGYPMTFLVSAGIGALGLALLAASRRRPAPAAAAVT